MSNDQLKLRGQPISEELIGQLRESSNDDDAHELRRRLAEDGYLLFHSVLDVDDLLSARHEVFSRLVEVGEIEIPAIDGIATGQSRRRECVADLIEFWRSVSEGAELRNVSHGAGIRGLMEQLFGERARPQDYLWLRPRPVGWSTGLHYDHPFFARGSRRVHTVWIPLGDIPLSDGPLVLVEDSHKFRDIIESIHTRDEQDEQSPESDQQAAFNGEWSTDTSRFLRQRNSKLLTTEFRLGDVLVFCMDMLHGSLDNCSPIRRTRLSVDVRYQPHSDPLDNRYFGLNPTGASGLGYGDMNSCKPLNEIIDSKP